jgi:hypothetical protein
VGKDVSKRLIPVDGKHTFVTLDDLIVNNLDMLFPGMEIATCALFRVSRNAIVEPSLEAANDLLELIETELRERHFAPIVRLEVQAGMDLTLYILFFFPAIIAFIYAGYGFAAQSWMNMERSAFSPAGPPIYHYKTLIPVTGVFMLLQGVVEVVRCLVALRTGAWPQRLHDVEELEKIILDQHADDGAPAK